MVEIYHWLNILSNQFVYFFIVSYLLSEFETEGVWKRNNYIKNRFKPQHICVCALYLKCFTGKFNGQKISVM